MQPIPLLPKTLGHCVKCKEKYFIYIENRKWDHWESDDSSTTLSQQKLQHSLFLTTVCTHLGAEQSSCSTIHREMLFPSCLTEDSSCSAVPALLCIHISDMFHSAGERPGRQSHALVIDTVQQSLTWKVSPVYTPCLSSHQFHQQAFELGAGKSKTGFSSLV